MTDIRGDQLAPHSIEAEEAVEGSILINPAALFEVLPFLRGEDFFIVRHQWIWEAILAVHERRDPIDYLTVVNELDQTARLAEVGGAAYILSLINKTPSALNVEGYGRIVERMAVRRRLIEAAQQVARVAHSDETDIDEVVRRAEQAIFGVTARKAQGKRRRFADVSDEEEGGGETVSSLIPALDEVTDGQITFGRTLTLLGASGHFKSTLARQVSSNMAALGHPALYVSQEMPEASVKAGMVAYQAYKNRTSVQQARRDMAHIPLEFVSGQQWVADIGAHVRAMQLEYRRPGVVVIDTLQKLRDCNQRGAQEQSGIAASSAAVDWLKLESGWLVIVLAQQFLDTNDQDAKRLRPSRNNIKGSKALYEDADIMVGAYWADGWRREFGADWNDTKCPEGYVMIKCIKNRYGKVGQSRLLGVVEGVPALADTLHIDFEPAATHAAMSAPQEVGK